VIRYDLVCDQAHRFDGWFRASADFDAQAERALLSCPVCGSAKVEKALMAPALSKGSAGSEPPVAAADTADAAPPMPPQLALVSERQAKLRAMLREFRAELTKNAVDVGPRFAEEARKIHYGEAEPGSIYGQATPAEARALAEEGVPFHPLPVLPDDGN